jgi:hypothetical protein
MADKKIQIDLKLIDKSSSDIKKFGKNIDKSLDGVKSSVKSTTSVFDKLKTSMANVSKPISAMKRYNDQIKQTEASIKRLSAESNKVKSIAATAGASGGLAGAKGVVAGSAITTGLAAGVGSGALGNSGITNASKGISDLMERNKALESGIGTIKNQLNAYEDIIGGTASATRDLSKAESELVVNKKLINTHTENLNNSTKKLASTTSTKLLPGWLKLVAVGYALTKFLKSSYQSYAEQIDAETKLSGVLKATGYTAGYTTEELKKYAAQLQKTTTYGDEVATNTMAILTSFRNVRGDVFKDATESILDMATVMGTDAASAALQLGKALNDPIDGISALTRVGVSFTEEQKKQIEKFIELGDVASAQKIILKELQVEFGGVAKEMAKTDVGKIKQMANEWDDLKEKVGQFVAGFAEALSPFFTWTMKMIGVVIDGFNKLFLITIPEDVKVAENQLERAKTSLKSYEQELLRIQKSISADDGNYYVILASKITNLKEEISKLQTFVDKNKAETKGVELGKTEKYSVDTSVDKDQLKNMEELYNNAHSLKLENDKWFEQRNMSAMDKEINDLNRKYQIEVEMLSEYGMSIKETTARMEAETKAIRDEYTDKNIKVIRDMEISIQEIKGNYREADLIALEGWYAEQKDLYAGHVEALQKIDELYNLQKTELQKTEIQKWSDEVSKMKVTWADVAENMSSSMSSGFDSMLDGTKSLKEGFDDMLKSMVNNLIKMVAEMYIYKAVAAGMDWAGGTSWGGKMGFKDGGVTPKLPGAADGNIFSGPMSGYPVNLHGNEAVIPLKKGKVPVDLKNNRQATTINMYISTPDASSFKRSRSQIMADIKRGVV